MGIILLLALGLRLPGWFTQDEKTRFRLFEPDEYQHVQIAVYQVQCIDHSLLTDWDVERKIFNARGFGIQLGCLAWLNFRLWGMPLSTDNLILLGRALSTLYALLLILLVFYLGLLLFEKREIALMASLLMAIGDLNVTYSHYALPAVSYVFWAYLFLGGGMIFLRHVLEMPSLNLKKKWLYIAFMAWAAAAAFAAKFDFIPVVAALLLFLSLGIKRTVHWSRALAYCTVFIVLFSLSFGLLTTFNFSLEKIEYSFWDLYRQNKDVIEHDRHWLYNPPVYLIGLIAGTSLPVALAGGFGLFGIWKKQSINLHYILFFLLLFALEFGVRWSSDIPFIRRANIFVPALALLAAYGWSLIKSPGLRNYLGGLLVLYTFGLCLVSQSNAWWDTRYAARKYLTRELAHKRIKYGGYAHASGMPPGIRLSEKEEILVIHESAYSRYWRSFTTPFRIPKCCGEVYHCGEEDCRLIQDILLGKDQSYFIIRQFRTREWFPERILFKKYLGNFETFLGDVLILERKET